MSLCSSLLLSASALNSLALCTYKLMGVFKTIVLLQRSIYILCEGKEDSSSDKVSSPLLRLTFLCSQWGPYPG